jgi:hypothetical protein
MTKILTVSHGLPHTPPNHDKEDDKSSPVDFAMFDMDDEKSSSVDLKMFDTEDSNAL